METLVLKYSSMAVSNVRLQLPEQTLGWEFDFTVAAVLEALYNIIKETVNNML